MVQSQTSASFFPFHMAYSQSMYGTLSTQPLFTQNQLWKVVFAYFCMVWTKLHANIHHKLEKTRYIPLRKLLWANIFLAKVSVSYPAYDCWSLSSHSSQIGREIPVMKDCICINMRGNHTKPKMWKKGPFLLLCMSLFKFVLPIGIEPAF